MKEISSGEIIQRESAIDPIRRALAMMDPKGMIEELRTDCRTYFRGVLLTIGMIGFGRVRVICCHRPLARQREIYGWGRTTAECEAVGVPGELAKPKMQQRTWCRPQDSKHVQRRAMDLDLSGYPNSSLELLGHVARSFKCTWGGSWKVRDYGHFEI